MSHSPCETSGTCDTSLRKQNDFNLPKTRGFKIASLNITSLPKHLDELRLNMINQHLDILILNETRLDNTISDSEISIDKYDIVRRDQSRQGGGVAVYIRSSIGHTIRNDIKDEDLEFLCVQISKPKVKPFLVST